MRAALPARGTEPEWRIDLLIRLAGLVQADIGLSIGRERDQLAPAVDRHPWPDLDLRAPVLHAHHQTGRHAATVQGHVVHARHRQVKFFPVFEVVATRMRTLGARRTEVLAASDQFGCHPLLPCHRDRSRRPRGSALVLQARGLGGTSSAFLPKRSDSSRICSC